MRYCAECHGRKIKAVLGSRCIRHYLWRQARYHRISKYGWWKHHVPKLSRQILGRYLAISEGFDPGNIKPIIQQFLMGDHSVHRSKKKARYSGIIAIVKIIDAADRHARKDYEASQRSNSSKEN